MGDIQILVKPNGSLAETASLVGSIVGAAAIPRSRGSGLFIEKDEIGLVIDEHNLVDDTTGPTFSKYPFVIDVASDSGRDAEVQIGRDLLASLKSAGLEGLLVEDQYDVLEA